MQTAANSTLSPNTAPPVARRVLLGTMAAAGGAMALPVTAETTTTGADAELLRPVDIHLSARAVAARLIMAAKLWSVLS